MLPEILGLNSRVVGIVVVSVGNKYKSKSIRSSAREANVAAAEESDHWADGGSKRTKMCAL